MCAIVVYVSKAIFTDNSRHTLRLCFSQHSASPLLIATSFIPPRAGLKAHCRLRLTAPLDSQNSPPATARTVRIERHGRV